MQSHEGNVSYPQGETKDYQHSLKNSYESQHNALLGMWATTRGVRPSKTHTSHLVDKSLDGAGLAES